MKNLSNRTKIIGGATGILAISTIISVVADKSAADEAKSLAEIGENAAIMFEDVTDEVASEFPDEL